MIVQLSRMKFAMTGSMVGGAGRGGCPRDAWKISLVEHQPSACSVKHQGNLLAIGYRFIEHVTMEKVAR